MINKPLVRFLCLPDIDRAIGGVKQLYRHVEHLISLGWDAAVITESKDFHPSWFASNAPRIALKDFYECGELKNNKCILVLPETYVGANLEDFKGFDLSSIPRVIFNQNAYYTYGNNFEIIDSLIEKFYDHPAVLHVMSVSDDTNSFLANNIGINDKKLSRIVNSIESIFEINKTKENKIHWMPRKNKDHVSAILNSMKRLFLKFRYVLNCDL